MDAANMARAPAKYRLGLMERVVTAHSVCEIGQSAEHTASFIREPPDHITGEAVGPRAQENVGISLF